MRHESIRLSRQRKRLDSRELLILNADSIRDEQGAQMMDQLAATNDTASEAEANMRIEELLHLLTEKQRIVICCVVFDGIPEHIVAAALRMSQQAVHRLKERALKRLREYMADS